MGGQAGELDTEIPEPGGDPPVHRVPRILHSLPPEGSWRKGPRRWDSSGGGGRPRPPIRSSCSRAASCSRGRGRLPPQSLFRFPRGSPARRRQHPTPPLPPPGNHWGKALGGQDEPGAQAPLGRLHPVFRTPGFTWGTRVGVTVSRKGVWALSPTPGPLPCVVSHLFPSTHLHYVRGKGNWEIPVFLRFWSGPVALLPLVTPKEGAQKSLDGVLMQGEWKSDDLKMFTWTKQFKRRAPGGWGSIQTLRGTLDGSLPLLDASLLPIE